MHHDTVRRAIEAARAVRSGKTPYVRFDLNDYPIPAELVRKPLTLASDADVRLLDGSVEIARHPRSYDRGRQVQIPRTSRPSRRTSSARASSAAGIGSRPPRLARALLEEVAIRGGHLGGTTARLRRLLDREGPRELDIAIGQALARGAASAEAVAAVLDQRRRPRRAPPAIDVLLSDDARARDVHVTPHSLDAYDDAFTHKDKTDERS